MASSLDELRNRINCLERRARTTRIASPIVVVGLLVIAIGSWTSAAQDTRVVRVRSLIVEDEQGRARVVLGAPVPDIAGGGRISESVGLVINDANGVERFAVGLQNTGRLVMGFDAPPGTGPGRNRERINIVADEKGGGYLRFLNRQSGVVGRLILDDQDKFYLEFLDFPDGKTVSRRVDFAGEDRREIPR